MNRFMLFVAFNLFGPILSANFDVSPIEPHITVLDGHSTLLEYRIRPWPPPRSDPEYDHVTISVRNETSNETLCSVVYKLGKYLKDLHSCNTRFMTYNPEFSDKVVFHLERTHLIDMGDYSMTLNFAEGRKNKTAVTHVEVKKAPSTVVVSKSPVGTLTEGDYLNLTCRTTEANPPPQLTWTRGQYRDIDNDPSLFHQGECWRDVSVRNVTVGPLTRHDHGISYICRAWNSVNGYENSAIASISVNVTHKPFATITHCPQHDIRYHVLEGADANMRTKIEAFPEVTMTSWLWNDHPIETVLTNTSREHIDHVYKFGEGERNLVLFDVERSMAGEYQFTVTNDLGTFTAKCELDVLYPPEITLPEEVTLVENGFLEITCQADANPPVHEYHWTGNGHMIQEKSDTLSIANVQPEDMAEYSCEAVNVIKETGADFGQRASGRASIKVNVEYKPRWKKHHPSKVAPRDGAKGITLVCDIDSYPAPNFQWLFNKRAITNNDPRYRIVEENGRSHLDIAHIKEGDYGTYVCHAMNVQGEDYFPIQLVKPGVPDTPEYCVISEKNATSVAVRCEVGFDGGSDLSYIVHVHITHHKAEVISYLFYKEVDHMATLVISELEPNTQYGIQIQAVNNYGKSKNNIEVIATTLRGDPVDHTHAVHRESSSKTGATVGLCIGVLLIVAVVAAAAAGWKGYLSAPTTYYRKLFVKTPVIKSKKLGKQYAELGQFSITDDDAGLLDCEQGPDVVTSPIIMTSSLESGTNVSGRAAREADRARVSSRPLTLQVSADVHQNLPQASPTTPTGSHLPASVPRKERNSRSSDDIELVERQASTEDRWEYPRDNLKLGWKLPGGGSFSDVWRATAEQLVPGKNSFIVAAKILKVDATKDEKKYMLREIALMKNIPHHQHILKMLACCTKKGPPVMLMEYMSRGSLLEVLRDHRGKVPLRPSAGSQLSLTARDLTVFALHIVSGLEFIFSHGWIHRDLACRNIYVDKELCCKLSDFSSPAEIRDRRQHEAKMQRRLPLRWMAPESMYHCVYTMQTDKWSLGTVLWEIITLGSTPYPGLSGSDVMELVDMDYRMKRPKNCPDVWSDIMTNCWSANPKDRPEISSAREVLETYLEELETGMEENFTLSELRDNIDEIMENTGGEKC